MTTIPINPITRMDYPDPDIIRVDDTYYMVSTTMYFMPGCEILRSYDLVHWEHASYVYDRLDSTDAQRLEGKENIYGQGMWAASLRYHEGVFFVCFVANDTHKTYVYTSRSIDGPWEKNVLEGFYHDNSILFDDDGRVYIIWGNKNIYIKELTICKTITGQKETNSAGVTLSDTEKETEQKLIISDSDDVYLGYEGSHFYKINGKYYIFLIHMPKTTAKRTESVFVADSPFGPYHGKDVMDDDRNYRKMGVAQGGIVDTPSGNWYSILFQDSGAVGRMPILMPVTWDDQFPVFGENGKIPEEFEIEDLKPGYEYAPLTGSDDFIVAASKNTSAASDNSYDSFGFRSFWQFNHEPGLNLITRDPEKGSVTITTDKLSDNLVQARNVLTQRTVFPGCMGSVDIDASGLKNGDVAGLCVLLSSYAFIGITRRDDRFYLVQGKREITTGGFWGERHDVEPFEEVECIGISEPRITLHARTCFDSGLYNGHNLSDDTAEFFFSKNGAKPERLGTIHKLQYKLDHFTGARFGLFVYSTREAGGNAAFSNFIYS